MTGQHGELDEKDIAPSAEQMDKLKISRKYKAKIQTGEGGHKTRQEVLGQLNNLTAAGPTIEQILPSVVKLIPNLYMLLALIQ